MDEDRATDELLAEMLTSLDPDVREQGWRIVLWRFGLPLKKYILALLNTRQMPSDQWEDIAQKTYSTAIELTIQGKYKGSNLYPWLCRIAKNHIGNAYRREQTHSRRTVNLESDGSQIDGDEYLGDFADNTTPEEIVLKNLNEVNQMQAFQEARKRLNSDERRLIDTLIQYPEYSIQQLADHLGENPKTVRNKKSLLLKKLNHMVGYFQQHKSGGDSDD